MAIKAILNENIVLNIILADEWPNSIDITNIEPKPSKGWIYNGETFSPPENQPEVVEDRRITKLAFWQRFQPQERVTIDLRSIHDSSKAIDDAANLLSANLRDLRAQVNSATFIDLGNPYTIAGVQQLESMGVLVEGRASEILNNPVTELERVSHE